MQCLYTKSDVMRDDIMFGLACQHTISRNIDGLKTLRTELKTDTLVDIGRRPYLQLGDGLVSSCGIHSSRNIDGQNKLRVDCRVFVHHELVVELQWKRRTWDVVSRVACNCLDGMVYDLGGPCRCGHDSSTTLTSPNTTRQIRMQTSRVLSNSPSP